MGRWQREALTEGPCRALAAPPPPFGRSPSPPLRGREHRALFGERIVDDPRADRSEDIAAKAEEHERADKEDQRLDKGRDDRREHQSKKQDHEAARQFGLTLGAQLDRARSLRIPPFRGDDRLAVAGLRRGAAGDSCGRGVGGDRKSTRLNSRRYCATRMRYS